MLPTNYRTVAVTNPAAILDNTSATTNVIDGRGFRFVEIFVMLGATDIALTALKVQEADASSDATTLTSGADITETVFGTAANDTGSTSSLPSATADNNIYKFEIDMRGRKRFLKPIITVGDGSAGGFVCAWANLHRGEQSPTTAAQKGVAQLMRVPAL